jgi:hypothetical protein
LRGSDLLRERSRKESDIKPVTQIEVGLNWTVALDNKK